MFSQLHWLVLQVARKVWVRATAFSVLGVLAALLALVAKKYIPEDLPTKIGSDSVDSLLSILATSMLSVTIFSLSTMVSAYASATSNVTPRATQLLIEDATAQNALATFVGSFLYSLVGIIVLQTGLYGATGRVVLYAVTLAVIVLVVATLLRWTDYVLGLGRVRNTTEHVEGAARASLESRNAAPSLGGRPMTAEDLERAERAMRIPAETFAYVQHIDVEALQRLAEEHDRRIFVLALPGTLVSQETTLCSLSGPSDESLLVRARKAFTMGSARSFDQDPRFGLCVLSEIASRALSPSLNDPGTAIDVLTRGTRLLALWREQDSVVEIRYPRVTVPTISLRDLFDDFFVPIARDGAAMVEVAVHVQKALGGLSVLGDSYHEPAAHHSRAALARAEHALTMSEDLLRVRRAAAKISSSDSSPRFAIKVNSSTVDIGIEHDPHPLAGPT